MRLPITMKRVLPGLYAGEDLRASKNGKLWIAEAKLRDVGELLQIPTGIYEASAAGGWMIVGSYRRLSTVEEIGRRLRAGTHMLRGEHTTSRGRVPSEVVPYAEVADDIAARTAPRASR